MYARWKRRALKRVGDGPPAYRLDLVLVESRRVDGRPRQRFVAHLSTIREDRAGDVRQRTWFWQALDAKLDGLGITGDARARIEGIAASRVAPPTPEERDAIAVERARRESEIAALFSSLRTT